MDRDIVQRSIESTRNASIDKPVVTDLKKRGVEFRTIDVFGASDSKLNESVKGAEIVISAVDQIEKQRKLVDAAKRAGVRRFIPSDWAMASPKGINAFHDKVSNCKSCTGEFSGLTVYSEARNSRIH